MFFNAYGQNLISTNDIIFKLMCRKMVAEYNDEVVKLCRQLMKVFSLNLGLEEDYLQNAFGGDEISASLRVNFYPNCPQPDKYLTLGISPHSDPGGITILLPDDHVYGLQVRKDDAWVTVKPIPNAFIVNLADQLQVLLYIFVYELTHICLYMIFICFVLWLRN